LERFPGDVVAKELRIGFIGAGAIAQTHAKHLSKIEGVQLVAAADPSEASLKKFADNYKAVATFADGSEMLKQSKLDAVCVCSPNGAHSPNTLMALDAGCHVMVEKPMAMNAAECQLMTDSAAKNKKHLVVGFQFRFDPRTELIAKHVRDGHFGKILYVRCQALRRRGIPNWGVFGRKDLQGGGPMIDIGVHCLEMAHFAIGSPNPISATGNCWTYHGNQPSETLSVWPNWDYSTYTVEDLAVGMIRFDTGAMLTIEASFVAHIEKDVWTFSLMGEKGGATWEPTMLFTDHNGYMMNMSPGFLPLGGWETIWDRKAQHFVQVLRGERPNLAPPEHGLMVQKMLDGVYASAAAGKEVRLL
jgi:predicted dehydrogenase